MNLKDVCLVILETKSSAKLHLAFNNRVGRKQKKEKSCTDVSDRGDVH